MLSHHSYYVRTSPQWTDTNGKERNETPIEIDKDIKKDKDLIIINYRQGNDNNINLNYKFLLCKSAYKRVNLKMDANRRKTFIANSAPDNISLPVASLMEYKFMWQNNLNEEELAFLKYNTALFPTDSKINYFFGIELNESGRLNEAVACYEVAIANYTTIPKISLEMIYIRLADSLNELKRYEDALKYADKSLATILHRFTARHDPHLCRAEAFYGLMRNEEAYEAIQKSVVINPNGYDTHYIRGCILYRLHRYVEAIKAFERAMLIDPNESAPYSEKASALFELGEYQSVIAIVNEAIERKLDKTYVHFLKMGAKYRLGIGPISQSGLIYAQAFNPGSPALMKLKQDVIESTSNIIEPPTKRQKVE